MRVCFGVASFLGASAVSVAVYSVTLLVHADCAETVQELTLELVTLQGPEDASEAEIEAERVQLASTPRLIGDYEHSYGDEERIGWVYGADRHWLPFVNKTKP